MLVGSPWVSAQVPSTAHCTRRQWAAPPGCRRQRQAAAAAAAGTHSRAASAAAASCPPATSLSAAAGPRSHAALTQAAASKPVTASVAAAAAAAAAGSSGGSGTGSAGAPATARLYRATCPLVGFEALEAALGPALPPQLALHHFVVVEPLCGGSGGGGSSSSALGTSSSAQAGQAVAVAFDFLPADPLSPLTAAALLSGGSVPGEAGWRLRKVPGSWPRGRQAVACAAEARNQRETGLFPTPGSRPCRRRAAAAAAERRAAPAVRVRGRQRAARPPGRCGSVPGGVRQTAAAAGQRLHPPRRPAAGAPAGARRGLSRPRDAFLHAARMCLLALAARTSKVR